MRQKIVFSVLIVVICYAFGLDLRDADLTTPQLIAKYGYTPETHFTTTEDGYILQLHRIVQSPRVKRLKKVKNVILLMHGATSSSADYIIAGPKSALGYYLSDLGYDVWMGNFRGNRYSRNHTSISPNTSKFWQITWDEMGVYDLSAIIDYVLKTTKHETLSYVGYSLGTTLFFVLCSVRPEYHQKINVMQAMAPVVYLFRSKNPVLRFSSYFMNTIEVQRLHRAPYELLPNTKVVTRLGKILCTSRARLLCNDVLFIVGGVDTKHMDDKLVAVLIGHVPAGISSWAVAQLGQMADQDRFGKFDFGREENIMKYGQSNPPEYNLSSIQIPVKLLYAENDLAMVPEDVVRLRDVLPNAEIIAPFYNDYNHLDYIIATNVREALYDRMVEIFKKYSRY